MVLYPEVQEACYKEIQEKIKESGKRLLKKFKKHLPHFAERIWGFVTNSDILNYYNCTTRFPRPLLFQTMNSVGSNSKCMKYKRLTPSVCKYIRIREIEFVAKLWRWLLLKMYKFRVKTYAVLDGRSQHFAKSSIFSEK